MTRDLRQPLARGILGRLLGNGLIGNAVSLYAVQGLNYLLPLLLLPYLLRVLSPEGYGSIMLAQSVAGYAIILTEFGFNLTAARDISVARNDPGMLARIYWTTMAAKALMMVASLLAVGIVILATPSFRSQWPVFAASGLLVVGNLAFPHGISRAWSVFAMLLSSRPYRSAWSPRASSYSSTARGIPGSPLSLWPPRSLPGPAPRCACAMPLAPTLFYRPTVADIAAALRHSAHMFGSILSTTLYLHTNTVVLGLVSGEREVALYSIGTKVVGLLQSVASPRHSSRLSTRQPAVRTATGTGVGAPAACRPLGPAAISGAALLVGVFAPFLVHIIGGPSYSDAAPVLRLMAVIPVLTTIASALSQIVMINIGLSKQLFRIYLGDRLCKSTVAAGVGTRIRARGAAGALLIAETGLGPIMMFAAIRRRRAAGLLVAAILIATCGYWPGAADAKAPELLHTPGYESPVQAGPEDLLSITGTGFSSTDRIVYEAVDAAAAAAGHPTGVPAKSTAIRGTAPLVKLAEPPYSLTIQLPRSSRQTGAIESG